ncbi:ArsR family transcriptional regulator [Natrinema sp. 74]|uniref:DUF7344 domain-containing protein n=1 Tax=Natrinema sp. 74 TaxID=3384159 RepID=UPI0038D43DE9
MSSDAHLDGDGTPDPLANVPTECYEILRHPRRLRLLEILGTRGTQLSLSELTTELLERTATDRPRRDVRISLVHSHLPRLEDHGIVDWDDDGVALVDEPPVHPTDIAVLLDLCETERAERLLETLVDPVRMRLLAVLEDDDQPLSVDRLAAELTALEGGPLSNPDRAKVALLHSHLPAMTDTGILEYDSESGLVSQRDHVVSLVQ